MKITPQAPRLEGSSKKIYYEPHLQVYGSVEKITQGSGTGVGDNAGKANRKTGG